MNVILDLLRTDPWPWYVSGPLIGLLVPGLLLLGNHLFGVSSSLRHVCAATVPAGLSYFRYEWRKEQWNLWLVAGIAIGGFIAAHGLEGAGPEALSAGLVARFQALGLGGSGELLPRELLDPRGPFGIGGLLLLGAGGFLVGFGARYAGGCTSGHTISGLATFQRASLLATLGFFAGGLFTARVVLPALLEWLR
ncbi:MAG: hypothetical protein RL026_72 [Pseudomonadota bacterium]|jgi:uncharacterized membrane protein YedE/YeeE